MSVATRLLEQSLVYRLWQLPFVEQKLRPLIASGEIARARRVLDVGCGPGTNAPHFAHADYVGIDVNPDYIDDARRRYGRTFLVRDVTDPLLLQEGKFDFIFLNSLLHHIETNAVRRLLASLPSLLADDGRIHILDLVLPPERISISRMLARADRGRFPRPLSEWRQLFSEAFTAAELETYEVGAAGVTLWNMVHCKAR